MSSNNKTCFILNEDVYSFRAVDADVFANVCEALDISIEELRDDLNRQDLVVIIHMMYYSIRDRKSLVIEDLYKLDAEHLELLLDLYIQANK